MLLPRGIREFFSIFVVNYAERKIINSMEKRHNLDPNNSSTIAEILIFLWKIILITVTK
jgi:hypothetical protein